MHSPNSPLPHQGGLGATIYLQWTHLSFQPQVDNLSEEVI